MGETGQYLCLSYCWGNITNALTSTTSNISERKKEIPWVLLPKTFQDAISFTRRLGQRYIWIDSLCILQNDPEDWEREASQMAPIYQNSFLTLAATSSADTMGGCFSTKDDEYKAQKLTVNIDDTPCTIYCRDTIPHFTGPDVELNRGILHPIQEHFLLLTRAWIYQERLLSPRVVHLGAQELIWECMERYNCECQLWTSYDPNYLKIRYRNDLNAGNIFRAWKHMVAEYTKLGLSFPSDRLPAMAGIAKDIRSSIESSYLAGLWEDHLVEGLLWTVPKDWQNHKRRAPKGRTPTWSWSSAEVPIVYPPDGLLPGIPHEYAKIEGVHHADDDDDYMGKSSAVIVVTSPVVSARLRYTPDVQGQDRCSRVSLDVGENCVIEQDFRADYDSLKGESSNHIANGLYFRPDYDFSDGESSGPIAEGTVLSCLLMWKYRSIGHEIFDREELEYSLVLRCVDDSNGFFERVGMLRKHSEMGVLDGAESARLSGSVEPTGVFDGVEARTVVLV